MANILVTSPFQPFTLPAQFKAVFNGYVYCGTVDAVDPSVSQVQVYLINESGDKVPVAQPLRTNAGGYLVYNGQPAKFVTDSNHSLLVQDQQQVQVWYAPDVSAIDPDSLLARLGESDGASLIGFIQGGTGAIPRTAQDKMRERVSLWDFHGSGGVIVQPGPSVDSRQYIQNAIDYLASINGGVLVIPGGQTWYLNSYGGPAIAGYAGVIQMKSNVSILLEAGAVVKLTSFFNEKAYCVFCGFNGSDPATSGDLRNMALFGKGTIDCSTNIQPIGSALCYAVGTGRSYNVTVRDIAITGGDLTWAVTMGWNGFGAHTVVDGISVTACKRTDIDRNADQSLFYVGCPFSGVRNCYLNPDVDGFAKKISAAVELHQHDTFCENNFMTGLMRGVYVVMHSSEVAGAGAYLTGFRVTGNVAHIVGQFVTLGAESILTQTHITDGVISGNVVTIQDPADAAMIGRNFIASDVWVEAPADSDTVSILVDGNTFRCPTHLTSSAFFFFRISTRGFYFKNNVIDAQQVMRGDGLGLAAVELRDIVWDESNTIASTWIGGRSGFNLFELYVAAVLRCSFTVKLDNYDASMAAVIFAPSGTSIDYSTMIVRNQNVAPSTTAISVSAANKNKVTNYFEHPETIAVTSFNSTGPVAFFSTLTDYGWVSSATPLSFLGDANFYAPPAYTSQISGQLWGLGYNVTGVARNGSVRMMLRSKV